ncbi:tyrosine-type recombinase/integrase, partial [Clostridium sp.]|uniref:tyrosine-type recombinase/integrase n=1 Tax=Clostridium sp. TaxID=1506 RepID=UPI001A3FB135
MLLIDDYLEYLNGSIGKSVGTIEQYKSATNLFIKYMKDNYFSLTRESIKKVNLEHIDKYLSSINLILDKDGKRISGCSNGTKQNKISALKSFFGYCKRIKLVKNNVILEIEELPTIPKRVRKYFEIEDCKKLIDSVGKRNLIRDKAIIILFLNTGLRLAELVKLNVNCVDDNNLTIMGKGNKERRVYLNSKLKLILKEYLLQRPQIESDALFLSERKLRISKSTVQNMLKNAIDKAGLKADGDTDMLVHVLRRTFATLEYQSGTDLNTL